MKHLFYFIILLGFLYAAPAAGQATAPIPDTKFLDFLKANYPTTINASNELIIAKAASVTGALNCPSMGISNLEGLQYFTGITSLNVNDNQLQSINQLSSLIALQTVHLENNSLTFLPDLRYLSNLKILIAYNNNLNVLPDLSSNIKLSQLIVYNNKLTVLPDLTALPKLLKLEAADNLLSVTPDLSSNKALTNLSLDRNLLTEAPDITNLNSLVEVELHLNYLTFDDLFFLLSHTIRPDGIFQLSPQKQLSTGSLNLTVYENDSLVLFTDIDNYVPDVTYTWYFNNVQCASGSRSVIYPVNFNHEGKYYCVLTHPDFSFSISSDTIVVDVINCPSIDPELVYGKINCLETGTLEIRLPFVPLPPYTYYLNSPATGNTLVNTNGYFKGLNQPDYTLTIKTGTVCKVVLPVSIPFEECKEAYITPNGDGENDKHFFSNSGTVIIYDKNGKVVQTLTIPGEWDGTSKTGQLVAPGYYFADTNKGETSVNISVLY